jgi:hypothetical protein
MSAVTSSSAGRLGSAALPVVVRAQSVHPSAGPLLGRLAEVENSAHRKASVDHLVGTRDQLSWKGEAEGFSRLEIDDHSEFRGQLNR